MLRSLSMIAVLLFTLPMVQAAEPRLTLVDTIPTKGVVGKLDHLAVDVKGERLFLTNKPNNTLDIFDLKAKKVVKQIADQGKASGVDYAIDLDMIYVGNGAGTCNAFNGKTYELIFSEKAEGADNVHYCPEHKAVYVGCSGTMAVLDAKTGKSKATIKLPGVVHGFKIDAKAGKIYAVLTKPSEIAVIDMAKNEVVANYPIKLTDGGSPIDQDIEAGVLFIGSPKKPMVVMMEAKTGKELGSVEIPLGIDDLHFDALNQRLYASCSDGNLAILEKHGDKYEVVEKLTTPKDSRTGVLAGGKYYLGVPKSADTAGPEVRVFKVTMKK
jgi:outer membrane protein assembly factor BamB